MCYSSWHWSLVSKLLYASGLAALPQAALADQPVIRWIAPQAGYPDAFSSGVSADGRTVLVLSGTLNTGERTACGLWTQTGGISWLPVPDDAAMCLGRGLSAEGDRVLAEIVGAESDPFRTWTSEAGWAPVEGLSGLGDHLLWFIPSRTGDAAAITGDGGVVVWSNTLGTTALWPDRSDILLVRGLNADGSVVVGWFNSQPARWTARDGWRPLGTGAFCGEAVGLLCSDDGSKIVGMGRAPGDVWPRIWWWDESRGEIEWMTASQFDVLAPVAMSADGGTVVGHSAVSAFVFTRENGLVDLNEHLAAAGVDTGGRWLRAASAVSNDGHTVVGSALYSDSWGTTHAEGFVLDLQLCPADLARAGGVPGADGRLSNDDFIVFIDLFFAMDMVADRGGTGGVAGPDGVFDSNDFVVYIDQFFAGC